MTDHIQNKLIHIQWQIRTYQSHITYIQGQIRRIHHLIHLVIVLLNFRFQKCRDSNPRPDPVGGSKPEPGLLRRFQLSSQNICLVLLNFHFQKCRDPNPRLDPVGESKPEPGLLRRFQLSSQNICLVLLNFHFQKCRDPNPRLDPVGESKPEPGLLRHFQLSSQNILFVLFHYRLFSYAVALHFGNPINVYKFKRSITFTFNEMHLQNNDFIHTYTHAIHFRMLSFYISFIISQHTISMQ